jgi:hypothetical protein
MRSAVQFSQTSRATYKLFIEENPDIKITYLQYINIIYSFNYGFRDYILETGMKGKLPWGIGDFAVSKRKPPITKKTPEGIEFINLPVDWAKTRKAGKRVYHLNNHTEGFKFSIKWFLSSTRFYDSAIWSFKPSRITSRLIKHYVVDLDKQHSYYEWSNYR